MTSFPAFHGTSILAQAAPASKGAEGILSNGLIMPLVLLVMFYVLMIRPQQKQRKEQAARIAALQTGDRIITSSGIHGIVHNVKEHTVIVKVAEGTMMEFDKNAVTNVRKKDAVAN
jgi:preprotein translocase subunit YajC